MAGGFLSCAACLRRAVGAAAPRSLVADFTTTRSPVGLDRLARRRSSTAAAAEPDDAGQQSGLKPAKKLSKDRLRAYQERAVKRLLAHTDDPWRIAQEVEQRLAKDQFDHALLLTQTASRSSQVEVAWNHLIDHELKRQRLKSAMKLYNDVRSRAVPPPPPSRVLTRRVRRR